MTLGDTHVEAYSACHRPSKHVLLRWFLLLTLSSGGCWLSFPLFSGLSDIIYIYIYIYAYVQKNHRDSSAGYDITEQLDSEF